MDCAESLKERLAAALLRVGELEELVRKVDAYMGRPDIMASGQSPVLVVPVELARAIRGCASASPRG
jgi:hypothetical protein